MNSDRLYGMVWFLLVGNGLLIFSMKHGFTWYWALIALGVFILGAAAYRVFTHREAKPQMRLTSEVAQAVQDAMEAARPICEEIFDLEVNQAVSPIIYSAEVHFREGLSWLWQSGDTLQASLSSGLAKAVLDLRRHAGTFASIGQAQVYSSVETKMTRLLEMLSELERMKDRDRRDLDTLNNRVIEDLEIKLQKEKEVMLSYLENLLAVQMSDEFEQSGRILVPSIDKLTDQFRIFMEKSIDSKIENMDDMMSNELGNLATKVVGEIQSFCLGQVNGIDQVLDLLKKIFTEKQADQAFLTSLNQISTSLRTLRDEANAVLFTLAWQEIMIEKQWQAIKEKVAGIQQTVLADMPEEELNAMMDFIKSTLVSAEDNLRLPGYRNIYQRLAVTETINRQFEGGEGTRQLKEAVLILFHYVYVLEGMVERSMSVSPEELRNTRLLREKVRGGSFKHSFDTIREEVEKSHPNYGHYLQDLYPQSFLNFCADHHVRSRPKNCGEAAWMLFYLSLNQQGTGSDADSDTKYLIGMLLVAHALRNRYIHPTRGSQYVNLESFERLDEIRTITFECLDMLGRMPATAED